MVGAAGIDEIHTLIIREEGLLIIVQFHVQRTAFTTAAPSGPAIH